MCTSGSHVQGKSSPSSRLLIRCSKNWELLSLASFHTEKQEHTLSRYSQQSVHASSYKTFLLMALSSTLALLKCHIAAAEARLCVLIFLRLQVEDTIAQMLDDSIVMTQSMGFSPFKAPFAERIAAWDAKLRLVSDTLEAWIQVLIHIPGS